MAIKRPVIVMALYDIGRDTWDNFTMSYDTYLVWMRNSLSLYANFIIYAEQKFIEKITEMRKEFDPTFEHTVIVEVPLKSLRSYQSYNKDLEQLMYSYEFVNKVCHKVPEMQRPLYNVIMFNKLDFIMNAKDMKYFDGDYFLWLDAGGLREDISNYQGVIWPSIEKYSLLPEDKITFFSHVADFDIQDYEYHAMSQIRYIQGTAFGVPKNMIDHLLFLFSNTIRSCIGGGYIGSDEKIFDLTYIRMKNKCNLIKCGWREYYNLFK